MKNYVSFLWIKLIICLKYLTKLSKSYHFKWFIYSENLNPGESVVALWIPVYIRFVFTCFDIWDWKFWLILNRSSPVKWRPGGRSTANKRVNHCVFWLAILDRIDFFIDFTITRKWLKTLRQTPRIYYDDPRYNLSPFLVSV